MVACFAFKDSIQMKAKLTKKTDRPKTLLRLDVKQKRHQHSVFNLHYLFHMPCKFHLLRFDAF